MDPISDMLVRIKNAQAVSHKTVEMPFSKVKFELAKLLEKESLVGKVDTKGKKISKVIEIGLKYENGKPAIEEIKRVSKPGQRVYAKKKALRPVRQGYGLAVVSTSQGLMTDKQARLKGLGGEIICEIY